VDLIEGDGGEVVPVDFKRGSPPDIGKGAWEPERVQLAALGMLLRENGYECTRGALWFSETRERVDVLFDEDLIGRTEQVLGLVRTVAADPEPPPPLVNSPKCPRCSLVGLCLPDEHNALTARSTRKPRRLVPRDE
jgi:CRISPR/Cas system-associated exonuclease Cas4 (RecB family)